MGCGCKKKTVVRPAVSVGSKTNNNGSTKTSVTVQTFKPKS